eukprot:594077-Rhodomonas_salina.3
MKSSLSDYQARVRPSLPTLHTHVPASSSTLCTAYIANARASLRYYIAVHTHSAAPIMSAHTLF